MVTSVRLNGADVPYHRVYTGKKYIGVVLIYPDECIARVAGKRHYRSFVTKEAAAAWIEKMYWTEEHI